MTDEIYDYFGGSSPRKMEPLDESEMFEDLLPSRKPEPVEEPPIEAMVDDDLGSISETAEVDAWSSQSRDNVNNDAVERSAPVKSHWDDLASSLGLSPPSAIEPRKASKPVAAERNRDNPEQIKLKTGLDNKPAHKSGDKTRPRVDKSFSRPETNQESIEPAADSFSELFISPEEIDFESLSTGNEMQPDHDFENDPFAAFSGSKSARRKEPEFEVEESQPEVLEINEPINKDFIEFEVQDIGGQRHDERETRSRRGRRPDRTEKRSGSEQARKPAVHDDEEATGESRETTGRRTQQQSDSRIRDSDRNEGRRDLHRSGNRSERNRSERNRAEGNRGERSRTEASRTESDRTESNRSDGNRGERNRSERNRSEGNRTEGNRGERTRTEGTRTEGSRTEGTRTEGNRRRRGGRKSSNRDNLERDPANRDQNLADRSTVIPENHLENSDEEFDNDIGIKKAKIPTWDEAIGGVVEQNIKRHQSNTKGGPKRRRT